MRELDLLELLVLRLLQPPVVESDGGPPYQQGMRNPAYFQHPPGIVLSISATIPKRRY
jgi:hypothetical protein